MLCGLKSQSGYVGGEKNLLPIPGFEPQIFQTIAWSLYWPYYPSCNKIQGDKAKWQSDMLIRNKAFNFQILDVMMFHSQHLLQWNCSTISVLLTSSVTFEHGLDFPRMEKWLWNWEGLMELCCRCRACLLVVQKWSKFSITLPEGNFMSDEQVWDFNYIWHICKNGE